MASAQASLPVVGTACTRPRRAVRKAVTCGLGEMAAVVESIATSSSRLILHGRRRSSSLNASHVDAPSCSDPLEDPLAEPFDDPLTMGTEESARLRVAMNVLTWPECEVAETPSTARTRSSLICAVGVGGQRGGEVSRRKEEYGERGWEGTGEGRSVSELAFTCVMRV